MVDASQNDAAKWRAAIAECQQNMAEFEASLLDVLAQIEAEGETPETVRIRTQCETYVALFHAMMDSLEPPASPKP